MVREALVYLSFGLDTGNALPRVGLYFVTSMHSPTGAVCLESAARGPIAHAVVFSSAQVVF